MTVAIRVEKGSQLVALWHTHGAPHRTRAYFSDVDTDLVEAMGLPLYLADPGGNLRVFRPGDRRLSALRSERLGLGRRVGYAKGALVARALNRPTQHAC